MYIRFRDDYELPGISTLTRLTSKVGNVDDNEFLKTFFEHCTDPRQKNVVLLIDEVYVKPQLTYQGGNVFGKAVNNPDHLATTVLSFMICSLFGGKKFLMKALPVYRLDSAFQHDQSLKILNGIAESGGTTVAIICDNNKVNQKFFTKFDLSCPWCTTDNLFLLYDYVHLIKSIRNNWLTEKMQELSFSDDGVTKLAKWSDLKILHNFEKENIVKLSRLNDIALAPKPVERQNVSTCLRVFCDETLNALKTHPLLENVEGTIAFLSIFISFFKIVNVKGPYEALRLRDENRAVISSVDDDQLTTLIKMADMVEKMMPEKQGHRKRQLTKDTARALSHTCRGLVDLTKYLLRTTHEYVCLGQFTSDPLEKVFSKLRQGSGGTYFINSQQVLQKVNIKKTKLCLDLNVPIDEMEGAAGHSCEKCGFIINDDDTFNIIQNLPAHESSLAKDVKMALVYIAGYVIRKDSPIVEDTKFYVEQFGNYTEELSRGGLTLPGDVICQWVFYSYIIFHHINHSVCRTSLCNVLMMIADFYRLDTIERKHGRIISNILFNNYCYLYSPKSSKEPKLKVLKLSSEQ